jgi:hypothetical protein
MTLLPEVNTFTFLQYNLPPCVPPSAKCVEGVVHHQRVQFCWCPAVTALQHEQSPLLCCNVSLAVVLSFWRKDHNAIWQSSITICFSQSLKTGLCTTTSFNFNFHPGALVLFRKHVVRALELGFYTSRRCTIQLNQTQPSPRTVLLQLNYFVSNPCIIISVYSFHVKYHLFLSYFNKTWIFSTVFRKILSLKI